MVKEQTHYVGDACEGGHKEDTMTIEPRPLTAERRVEIEAEHTNCPTPGCTPRDLMSALLHAEQRIAELEGLAQRAADGDIACMCSSLSLCYEMLGKEMPTAPASVPGG